MCVMFLGLVLKGQNVITQVFSRVNTWYENLQKEDGSFCFIVWQSLKMDGSQLPVGLWHRGNEHLVEKVAYLPRVGNKREERPGSK